MELCFEIVVAEVPPWMDCFVDTWLHHTSAAFVERAEYPMWTAVMLKALWQRF